MAKQKISKREQLNMNLCRRFLIAIVALVCLSSSESLAQIGWVNTIGANSSKTSGTSLAVTVPTGGVAAGNSIILWLPMDPATGTVSCTDSAANSYVVDLDQINGSGTSGVRTVILSAHNISALASGNIITCTHPSVAARALNAEVFTGLLTSGAKDQVASATGQSATPSSGNTPMTSQAVELLVGAIGSEGPSSDTFAPDSGSWSTRRVGTSGGNPATNITIFPEFRIVTATGAYAATGTLSNSRKWAAAIVTYKAKPPPAINNLTPTSGPIATPVTINGSNFGATQGTSTVRFNGVAATATNWSNTSITATVPAGASTGAVVVTVSGVASNGVTFTVTYSPRVNAGGFAYTDGSGNYWAADQAYGSGPWGNTGGSPFSTGDPIANTTDDVLYQSERFGNFGYKFDVPNGKYDVAVHLAEIWFSSAGQRFFKILIEGAVVLDNYDIFTEVGHDTAIIKTFYSIDVQDGQLNVDFVPISNNAKVSAIAISPARPTKLAITSVNAGNTVTAGVGFPVVVQAQNPNGAPTNVTVSTNVSLSVKSGAGNLGGTISGTIPVGASQITFSGVTYSKADQGVVLTATATSGEALVPGDSAPFSVVVGSPNKLGIIFQPVNSTTSGAIKGPPTVAVQDSAGNTITSSSAAITVAIATNPGSGTLTGTTVRNAASGVGAFADLKIDQTGNGYTLAATSPGLTSATTAAFNITTGGNVAGTVTKAAGGGAITGASVEALQAGVVKGTASTNSAGSYTISGLAPGTYDIRADAGGFSPQTQSGVTVNAGATATANFSLAVATATAGIVYIYDELQRLKSVIDPVGEAATYAYDAVGNLLTIARNNASQVSVLDFNPNSGAVGSTVTIYGTGYSATPSQNSVTFNGIAAPVTSSTLTQIVTTVPAGATTGPIAVTSPAGSATSGTNFTVSGAEGAPTIANFSPTIGTAGTPVTISGTNFESVAIDNDVRFNRFLATVSAATSTSLSTTVPSTTTSGRISVTTRLGTAVSSADFVIPPSPYTASDVEFTGRMTIGGASFTATINTVGKIALVLFDGTAGEKVGFAYSNNTFTNLAGNILRPDGSVLASLGNFLSLTLPVTGTYTILLRPGGGTNVGSVTFTLSDELDAGSAVINGASKTVTIDRIGQRARVTFSGTAGELFGIGISSNTFTNLAADILRPDGAFFASFGSFVSLTLPVTGTYTILFRPSGTGVGSVTFLMTDEQDAGGFAINGPSKSVTIDRIGQRARVTFTGTAGELVGIGIVSNTFTNLAGDIKRPDGSVFASFGNFVSLTLPDTGTYTILFRPSGTGVGSVSFIMTDEQDAGSVVINGASKTVTIDRIGQRARITFTGTATHVVTIAVSNSTFTNLAADIKKPDGTILRSDGWGTGTNIVQTLPDSGTYTILIRPDGTGVGSVTFAITE